MRIAHIIPNLNRGGAEQVVVTLANGAAGLGHEVFIFTAGEELPGGLAERLSNEVELRPFSVGTPRRFLKYGQLFVSLRRNHSLLASMDVIHVHLLFGTIAGAMLGAILRGRHPKIVETFHAAGMPLASWKRGLTASIARRRDAFVLMADDPALERVIGSDDRVHIIPNGINLAELSPIKWPAHIKSSPHNERPLICSIGRLVAERNPQRMLEVFQEIHARHARVRFVMGGDGPLKEEIKSRIERAGLTGVIALPGMILDPPLLMRSSDLYISINVGSLTGIAGLEAAAQATPVIALQMIAGRTAQSDDWIWSHQKPENVADKAIQLLGDNAQRLTLARRQQDIVRSHFSADAMNRAYLRLYSNLTGSPSNLQ